MSRVTKLLVACVLSIILLITFYIELDDGKDPGIITADVTIIRLEHVPPIDLPER